MPAEFQEKLNQLDYEIRNASLVPDECQGLPLPGYVGNDYLKKRILFVAQSPGQPGRRHTDGYWAGNHHYTADMDMDSLRSHYFEGLLRCPIGDFVKTLLEENSLSIKNDIAYTNVVKCATKDNKTPSKLLIRFWQPYLLRQLEFLEPRLIVCLGKIATEQFSINTLMFDLFRSEELNNAIVLYLPHPSYIKKHKQYVRDNLQKKCLTYFKHALVEAGILASTLGQQ